MAESKVPGFTAGEFLNDPADPRLNAVLPRVKDEPDETYLKRLEHNSLAVVITREEMKQGGFPRALAKAISLGTPVIRPREPGETRPEHAFGTANQGESKPIDMVEFRRQAAQREADPGYNSPINPR